MRRVSLIACILVFALLFFWSEAVAQTRNIRVCSPGYNTTMMPIFIAKGRGYFAQEGMEVEVIVAGGLLCTAALMADQVNFTINPTTFDFMIAGQLKGKVVYGLATQVEHRFIVAPEIRSVEDLKGKRIAISSFGGISAWLAREILAQHGLEPMKDVLLLQVGTGDLRYAALKVNRVQAALLSSNYALRALDEGFGDLDYKKPPTLSLPIIAKDEMLARERSIIRSFLRAVLKGHLFFGQKREETVVFTQQVLRINDKAMAKRVYEDDLRRYNPGGQIEAEAMRQVIKRTREMRKIEREVYLNDVFDLSIAAEVEAELKKAQWKP